MSSPADNIPVSKLFDLTGKGAIVTGGASGLGLAISYRLAEAGASILIVDANDESARQASRELCDCGYRAKSVECDVSSENQVRDMVTTAVK